MTKYIVRIKDVSLGSWEIEAPDEAEAEDIAQARLADGDISWRGNELEGYIEVDVEKKV